MASYTYQKQRREKMLRKMENWRIAKARKRIASPPPDREPKMQRAIRFKFRVLDTYTGDKSGWYELRSLRDATKRLACLTRYLS